MTDETLAQLLAIRDSGETNMFNVNRVRDIALMRGFLELVRYIDKDGGKSYCRFILFGKEPEGE